MKASVTALTITILFWSTVQAQSSTTAAPSPAVSQATASPTPISLYMPKFAQFPIQFDSTRASIIEIANSATTYKIEETFATSATPFNSTLLSSYTLVNGPQTFAVTASQQNSSSALDCFMQRDEATCTLSASVSGGGDVSASTFTSLEMNAASWLTVNATITGGRELVDSTPTAAPGATFSESIVGPDPSSAAAKGVEIGLELVWLRMVGSVLR